MYKGERGFKGVDTYLPSNLLLETAKRWTSELSKQAFRSCERIHGFDQKRSSLGAPLSQVFNHRTKRNQEITRWIPRMTMKSPPGWPRLLKSGVKWKIKSLFLQAIISYRALLPWTGRMTMWSWGDISVLKHSRVARFDWDRDLCTILSRRKIQASSPG